MFKDDLFRIRQIDKTENKFAVQISFDGGHEIFRGHFPDKKVVPGVILMQMIKEISEEILDVSESMITDAGMKFLNPVLVDESDKLEVELMIEEVEKNSFKVRSVGKDGDKKSFKIDITLRK